jgi:hypothetical protein
VTETKKVVLIHGKYIDEMSSYILNTALRERTSVVFCGLLIFVGGRRLTDGPANSPPRMHATVCSH